MNIVATQDVDCCNFCGKIEYSYYAYGYDYEMESCKNKWQFVQCPHCTLIWLHPRPDAKELSVIYPDHYYSYEMKNRVHPIALWGKWQLDKLKLNFIMKKLEYKPKAYLDVGCGDGKYLDYFFKLGLSKEDIFGIEIDKKVIDLLDAKGYAVDFNSIENSNVFYQNKFDLITMFHVIEHVSDPACVLKKLFDILIPGGVLAIETPNVDSLDANVFKKTYWGGYHIPRHWFLFNAYSLSLLLSSAGFEIKKIKYLTGHSFWMYSVHHLLKYKYRLPKLARFFDPTKKTLFFLFLFTAWDKLRAILGRKTSSMLMIAKKPKKSYK